MDGRSGITSEAARELAGLTSAQLAVGVDKVAIRREERVQAQEENDQLSRTFAVVLKDYVEQKRRAKDGLALKARTKADYLAMVEGERPGKRGFTLQAGELFDIASVPVHLITAERIEEVHAKAAGRGQRRQGYAMQVLRAVLNWEGVQVADSPLAITTPGKDRIRIASSKGDPRAIPSAKLGSWWRAASSARRNASWQMAADIARLLLLTGCRPGELMRTEHEPGLLVERVNLEAGEFVLDPKNRKAHTVKLSTEALEIIRPYVVGKKPGALVFPITEIKATMRAINEAAGVDANITPKNLRSTFVSIAGACLPYPIVKKLVNHTTDEGGKKDVTLEHYFAADDDVMRAAWQTIATMITKLAASEGATLVPLAGFVSTLAAA
jgi:integrase